MCWEIRTNKLILGRQGSFNWIYFNGWQRIAPEWKDLRNAYVKPQPYIWGIRPVLIAKIRYSRDGIDDNKEVQLMLHLGRMCRGICYMKSEMKEAKGLENDFRIVSNKYSSHHNYLDLSQHQNTQKQDFIDVD